VGTNKQENKDIINASKLDDIWFHLDDNPSCHIVAKVHDITLSKKQKRRIIRQGEHLVNMQMKTKSKLSVIHSTIKNVRE
jgi:predicted ribosome quality control (RQC) complex YloA/Tae2 family protein